ncbi:MAG TPA: hypothetical protein VJ720_05930, partial [Chitinophaga sp.]|nr:hypothetical protein [Chitinophaga sp.]
MADNVVNNEFRVTAFTEGKRVIYEFIYPLNNPQAVIRRNIEPGETQEVYYMAPDRFNIKGKVSLVQRKSEQFLYGNLYYGKNENLALQKHFDGTMVILSPEPPPPPITPVPPSLPSPSSPGPDPEDIISSPLFPYVDVTPWPQESTAFVALNFITYTPGTGNSALLYSQLSTLQPPDVRKQAETLCLDFINGQSPFEGQYFESPSAIPMPFTLFPDIYDRLQRSEDVYTIDRLLQDADLPDNYQDTIQQVWQNYFALSVFPGFNKELAIALNKVLVILHCFEIQDIAPLNATIVLPSAVFPLPPYDGVTDNKDRSIVPYAVGELKMVKFALRRYEQGEIAHIENILKGERKKSLRRNKQHTTSITEEGSITATDDDESFREATQDLVAEAKKTLTGYVKTKTYNNFQTTYGPPTEATLNGSWSTTRDGSKNPGAEDKSRFVRKVLNRTVNRIRDTISKKRLYTAYNEQEEVNTSIFDNSNGTQHFRGIYRWLNKIYTISLENYGHRFLLEIRLKDPARDYIRSQQLLNNINMEKPLSPAEKGIHSFRDITRENYTTLAAYYNIDNILLPPQETLYTGVSLQNGETEKQVELPDQYVASAAVVSVLFVTDDTDNQVSGFIGGGIFTLTPAANTQELKLTDEGSPLSFSVAGIRPSKTDKLPAGCVLHAKITCKPLKGWMDRWKADVYKQITAAWQKQLEEYTLEISRLAGDGDQTNTMLLRDIEYSSIQRSCRELLMNVFTDKQGVPEEERSTAWVNRPAYYQFIQHAFEWDEMTFVLDDAPLKYNAALQSRNTSLRPFLQAETATVFLPVRPEDNYQVLYYLSSGVIWELP